MWLLRRAGIDLPRRVAALFYLLVLLFLFRPMTGPWVNFPTDVIELVPPWSIGSKLTKFSVSNPQLPDLTMQIVPWAHQVREAWRAGELPLWNALAACGMPLAGNGQSSAFSPFRLLALPLPLGYAMTAEAAMKILAALTFTFLFCRRRRMSYAASIISAISFAFSTFVVVWLHFPIAAVAVFIPAVFYGIDLLAENVTSRRFAAVSLLWAASLLGGHPETSAHIAMYAAMYVIWILVTDRTIDRRRFALAIGGATIAAALLALPLLVSMQEVIVRSHRYHELRLRPFGDVPYSDIPSLLLLLQPQFYGSVPEQKAWAVLSHAESISGFAGILGMASLVGVVAAALFRRMAWRSVEVFFALGWVLAFAAIANAGPIGRLLQAAVPFTAHGRQRLLICWFSAVLAGALVDRLRDERTRRAFLSGLAVAAIVLVAAFMTIDFPDAEKRNTILMAMAISGVVVWSAAAVRPLSYSVLTMAVMAELWLAGHAWNPVMPASTAYPRTPLVAELEKLADRSHRIAGIDGALFPNVQAVFGFEDVRAHDPVVSDRYWGVLKAATKFDPREYYGKWKDPDSPMLDYLNARWVVTEPGAAVPRMRLVYDGRDGRIYENPHVLPRFFAVTNAVQEPEPERLGQRLRENRDWRNMAFVEEGGVRGAAAEVAVRRRGAADFHLDIRAPQRALIVSSEAFWPGWRIETDRASLKPLRVNGAFLGFVAPAGNSAVRVRYFPVAIYAALAVSAAMFAALTMAALRSKHG